MKHSNFILNFSICLGLALNIACSGSSGDSPENKKDTPKPSIEKPLEELCKSVEGTTFYPSLSYCACGNEEESFFTDGTTSKCKKVGIMDEDDLN